MEKISNKRTANSTDGPSYRLRIGHFLATGIFRIGSMSRPLALILKPFGILCEGALLGILRRKDVDSMVSRSYASEPEFYDPNRYKLPYEEGILTELRDQVGERRQMLDAFCGQGREAEIFTRAGFKVTGVDSLDWMIEGARKHFAHAGLNAEFEVADFMDLSTARRFEIVYTSLWMYTTYQGADRRMRFLDKCRELCADSGIIVVSCVDAASFSKAIAVSRFLIARTVGVLTLGNFRSEMGERIYGGLFWHHLSEATVHRDFSKCGLKVMHAIKATGIEPTFYFLSPEKCSDFP